MVPVAIALAGRGIRRPTVAFIGWFGPRGLASIVFALLALERGVPDGEVVLTTVVVTVALSVVLHGLTSAPLVTAYHRWYAAHTGANPEAEEATPATMPRRRRQLDAAGLAAAGRVELGRLSRSGGSAPVRELSPVCRARPCAASRAAPVAAPPAQDPREADRDQRAGDRADHVRPVVGEVEQRHVRPERARRVHRRPADGARPQPGEDDVAADGERAERADVLRAGGRARGSR